ncbi:MAG: TIGR02281 family clan AA aspartic protease [Octadecabacter sp.]
MFGLDAGQLIALAFLIILGLSLLGSILNNSTQLRNALIWIAIFGGMFMFSSQLDTASSTFVQRDPTFIGSRIEVPKGRDNHFRLTLRINGVPVDFLIDTGASQVVLTQEDAARVGLDPDTLAFIGTAFTANGEVATAPVRLDTVDLGDMRDTRVRASVNSGDMEGSLLGMSYLSRFESIEIRRDVLILNR